MSKQSTRIWSLLLVIIMLINMLPVYAFASENEKVSSEKITMDDSVVSEEPYVVKEIVEHRTEYIKQFQLSNGLQLATVYAYPVHYEENGEWKEIDNTLTFSETRSGNTYTNTAGVWNVDFPQSLTKNNGISITKDGHTLNFKMTGEMHDSPGNLELKDSEIITVPTVPADFELDGTVTGTEPTATDNPEAVTAVPEENGVEQEAAAQAASRNTEMAAIAEGVADVPSATAAQVPEANEPAITMAAPAEVAIAAIENIDLSRIRAQAEYPETVIEKLASRLSYADIYENTDIVFDLSSNQFKESVIMKQHSDTLFGYSYELNTGEMIPVLLENGDIELRVDEEVIMFMPAPYLIDEEGETSYDVEVSVAGENGSYVLTYILPQEWLAEEERAWPVVLDPIVFAECTTNNIADQTVYSGTYMAHTRGSMMCGYRNSYGKSRIYLMYTQLPDLSAADVIISSSISLYKCANSANPYPVEVHKVPETWEVSSIEWETQPEVDPVVVDYAVCQDEGYYTWDVTDIARGWYEGENTGMMFKVSEANEAGTTETWRQFYSSDYSAWMVPTLAIAFRNNNGLESYWDYTSSSAGRAGTGYVNHYTGNIVWVRNDIGFGGNLMPVSISHVYNANDNKQNLFGMGYGWRTNFNQRVYHWDEDYAYSDYYVWEDSDGTRHYFEYESANTYKDEDGLELTLKTNGSGTEKYTITDKYDNASYFDTAGRLTKQINNQATPSSILITYTTTSGYLISTVTDGAGRVYSFTYNNNLLSHISYTGTGTEVLSNVNFAYDANSNLVTVTDRDAKQSTYTYAENHLLQSAQDIDGYKLSYQYRTTTAGQPNRIWTITESDGNVRGTNLAFEYAHNQTKLTKFYGDPTDEATWDIQTTQLVQFNNMGNTISIQDDEGKAQYAQYAINDPDTDGTATANTTETDTTAKGNQLRLTSRLQNTVANMLEDSSFEDGTTWWRVNNGIGTIDTTTAYMGSNSIKLTTPSSDSTNGISSDVLRLSANTTYTFSAYVKTTNGSAYLAVSDGTDSAASEVLPANSDWTRLEVSYTTGASVEAPIAKLLSNEACVVYMDCVQLEKAPTASRYNILQNGDFAKTSSGWSSDAGRTTVTDKAPAEQLDNKVYTMAGDPTATNRISQTVNVSGENGDTYVLAGWAKADSVPIKDDREFGLIATFKNGTTVVNKQTVRFNDCADSTIAWQYAASSIVAEGSYDSILIEVAYDYNANTAYFDGIQLFKEEFGNSYRYDDDGNIISVVDMQKQETTYEYTDNDLTAEVLPNGSRLTYEYDDWHNVTKATSETGVIYEFTYDTHGNNTSVSITHDGKKLTSSAVYSTNGNYLVSTTDAAGNTTTYNYDANTGVLLSVKYPNDEDGPSTTYTYDNMYRLATAAMNNDGTTLSASYTYENDLLTKITTGSTTYNFAYGDFSLRSSIKVGNQLLAEYSYADQTNYLETLEYGNGDSVNYDYDSHGRLTAQTYEDNDKVTYQYDNNGALAVVSDSSSGITTTYYYDFTDRLMKYAEKASNFSHIVGYEYDNINNLTKLTEQINTAKITSSYAYDEDNRVTSIEGSVTAGETTNTAKETYSYDAFGRLNSRTTGDGSTNILTETLGYYTYSNNTKTSGQVSTHNIVAQNYSSATAYTYDANGNIATVKSSNKTIKYTYDTVNQLIREDNPVANKTWIWTYDDAGNISSCTEYAYTLTASPTGGTTTIYAYNNSSWGDLLTSYQVGDNAAVTITSDSIGNMTSDGTRTYTWEHGRELLTLTKDGITWTNTYNADGLRTKRTNGTTTYSYVYNGSSLSQMSVGTNLLNFVYDASGSPMAVVYNGTTYYYVTNLQGDVVAILDSTGADMVKYTYNAWGQLLTTTGTMATTLGVHNPLRYRGYVYDSESSLYYLQSRYYDPQLGRFINADAFTSTGQGILGNNMFAYCNNSPVTFEDASGYALKPCTTYINDGNKALVEPEPDPLTVSMGASASITLGPIVYGAQIALVTDSYGVSEYQFTFFVPISSDALKQTITPDEMLAKVAKYEKITDLVGFSLMGNISAYNTPNVENLYDMGYQVGGAIGAGGAIAVDYNIIPNGNGTPYKGITISIGMGSTDLHASMGSTIRIGSSIVSVYDLADVICRGLYGG